MRTLIALLLSAAAMAQTAFAQTELPSAIPYSPNPVTTTVVSSAVPSFTAPIPAYSTNPFQVSYTVTLSGTFPNPRATALDMAIKEALALVLQTQNPPASAEQIKKLTKDTDPATFLTTYQITEEVLTPRYKLGTNLTFNARRVQAALEQGGTAPAITNNAVPEASGNTVTLRFANPTPASLNALITKAQNSLPGTRADVTTLARDAAYVAVTTPDIDVFLTRLQGQGLSVEPVGTVYWVE